MKRLIILVCMATMALCTWAQNWTKTLYKEFKKAPAVAFVVDMTSAEVMGVSAKDFPAYLAGKYEDVNEEFGHIILQKFSNQLRRGFFYKYDKEGILSGDARFVIYYKVRVITEQGGFKGTFYVDCEGNRSGEFTFSYGNVKNRHKTFDELLMESIEKYWRSSDATYSGDPMVAPLYKYK